MKDRMIKSVVAAGFFLGFGFQALFAGGPIYLEKGGKVYRWNNTRPVPYSIDRGRLGILSEAESLELVRNALEKWNKVPSATVSFQEGDRLDLDVNVDNYREFFGFDQETARIRPENPVIFDENGAIVDDYLGEGASETILGFAGIRFLNHSRREFTSGWVVLNGAFFNDRSYLGLSEYLLVHESGHLIGLEHTQNFLDNFLEEDWVEEVPVMFPFFKAEYLPKAEELSDLERDDITWLSWLYPSPRFLAQEDTGTIRGRVLRPSGEPLLGANVFARKVVEGELSRSDIISTASGFLMLEEGEFELPGLEPGDYVVGIEPLQEQAVGPSGVGPYDLRPSDFPLEYFDAGESSTENPEDFQVISVSAGETVDGLVIVANETPREASSLGDDDEILYTFPEGFSFPFFGKVYKGVYLSSDGILSFRIGDHPDGSPRSEARFLGGPPRIAPLYADLNPAAEGGEVRIEASREGGFVTFIWDQVPLFAFPQEVEGNSFSVTLFKDGDIRISYGEIHLPSDLSGDLRAVVGITPGRVGSGSSRDLSEQQDFFPGNWSPVYEVFHGDEFDLEGSTLHFNASRGEILFPYLRSTSLEFTGYAVTNLGEDPVDLLFEARDRQGNLTPGVGRNPSGFELQPDSQLALLGREIFNAGPFPDQELSMSWVRILAGYPEVAGLAQSGNGLGAKQTYMDGAIACNKPSTKLFFTRIFQGESAYPFVRGAGVPAITRIALANPNEEPVVVTLGLYGSEGELLGSEVVMEIEAFGHLGSSLGEFVGWDSSIREGYIKAESSGGGLVGFELIELNDTWIGLNAAIPTSNRILYSAQLAHHWSVFTNLKLVNPTDQEISFEVIAYLAEPDGGIRQITSPTFSLPPDGSWQEDVGTIFWLPYLYGNVVVGSMKVVASAPGIVGDVIFGDPGEAAFAAALPLQDQAGTGFIFSHISNGRCLRDPSRDAFTGLAVFNPGALETRLSLQAFDSSGNLLGETSLFLEPGGRISQTLLELVPETEGISGGYVRLESSQPVVAQQLFGNAALDYLSALPPTIVEPNP